MNTASSIDPTAPRQSLLTAIAAIARGADDDGLTLAELVGQSGERVFGVLLFVLALPCCIPFLYGVPQIVAVPMMAIALQMAAGREGPWLPNTLGKRRIDKTGLERMARGGAKYFGWMERLASQRLGFMTHRVMEPVLGIILVVFCASILTPLPSTNTIPGIAVAIIAYGMIERDGLFVIIGVILGLMWITLLGTAVYIAWDVLTDPEQGTRDLIKALFERLLAMFSGDDALNTGPNVAPNAGPSPAPIAAPLPVEPTR